MVDKQEQLRDLSPRPGSFLSYHVVGWLMAQSNVHVLISRSLYSKRDFADVIKLRV